MKTTLQVLLHALCGVVGFLLAASQRPEEPTAGDAAFAENAREQRDAGAHSAPGPQAAVETGLSRLTPEDWEDAMPRFAQDRSGDLPAMLRDLQRNPYPEVNRRLLPRLFESWASLDRPGAIEALDRLRSPQERQIALRSILSVWANEDTESAWRYLTELDGDSVLQESGILAMLELDADGDPRDAAAWVDELPDVFLREKALTQIAATWSERDRQGALAAALTAEPERLRELLLSALSRGERAGDHAAGLEIVSQLPSPALRSKLSAQWLRSFASRDQDEAFQWLLQRADWPELQKAGSELGGVMASKADDFESLRTLALRLPAGPLRDAFASRAASQWASSGRPVSETEALLELSGPCVEREWAREAIEQGSAGRL